MAITLTKEPTGLYPAYNDSYLEFTSNLAGDYKAEITVAGVTGTFTIYPVDGVYLFNLKNIVASIINGGTFRDQDTTYPLTWMEVYNYGNAALAVTIKDFNTSTNGSVVKNYTFIRGVKQVGEQIHTNPYQLMHPSDNGVDYQLTYFEGYPFSFEIAQVTTADSFVIRNLNSTQEITPVVLGSTDTWRVYIDKEATNWTSTSYLPLTDTKNRLELEFNSVVETNLTIKKVFAPCGVYVKWLNADGGYSYWLFDEFFRESFKGKDISFVNVPSFNNVDTAVNTTQSTGKIGTKQLRVKSKAVEEYEMRHLESLMTSPSVQLWSSNIPASGVADGYWVDVTISGDISRSTKKALNEVALTINLPELKTAQL